MISADGNADMNITRSCAEQQNIAVAIEQLSKLAIASRVDLNANHESKPSADEGRQLKGRRYQTPAQTAWQPTSYVDYPLTAYGQQQYEYMQPQQPMQPMPAFHQQQPRQQMPPRQQAADYQAQFMQPVPDRHLHFPTYDTSTQGQVRKTTIPKASVNVSHGFRKKVNTFPPKQASRQAPQFHRSLSLGAEPLYPYQPHVTTRSTSHPATTIIENEPVADPLSPDDGISMTPIEEHPVEQGLGLVGKSIAPPDRRFAKSMSTVDEESGSDSDLADTHPNKFSIAIEEHTNRNCAYRRQPVRSGPQVKVVKKSGDVYNLTSVMETPEVDQDLMRRYYRKDLVRVCVCGKYDTKEPLLENRGRDNDADGYEVHYNIKCKWKSYEDFKTKKRVIIRLCKCYKPSF